MINISSLLPTRGPQQTSQFKSSWDEVAPRQSQPVATQAYARKDGGDGPSSNSDRGGSGSAYIPSGPPSAVVEAEYLIGEKKQLSAEQKLVLDLVLAGKSVFFTGAAGTGKSFVLQCLRQILTERGLIEKTYFTGTTGIAAINVGGSTLHSFAGIGLGNGTAEFLVGKVNRSRNARTRWKNAQILVVDEISMLEADLFDKLALIGSRVRSTDKPFGGIQLVLCGDFFQLPPVKRVKGDVRYAFNAQYWHQAVGYNVVLGRVYRQKDETFLQILNELRQGLVTPQAEALLLKQVAAAPARAQIAHQFLASAKTSASARSASGKTASKGCGEEGEEAEDVPDMQDVLESFEERRKMLPTLLFSRNVDVDAMNEEALAALDGPAHTYEAEDVGHSDYINLIRNNCPAPQVLELKLGAQVLLLKNLDLSRGLCNGSRGVVIGFTHVRNLRDADAATEEATRRFDVYPKVAFFGDTGNPVVVHIFADSWNVEERGVTLASRSQIPLRLAWAITIHKSQGMTISNLEITFQGIFDYGQAYVALSRSTGLEGLVLRDFNKNSVRAHHKVHAFYAELHKQMGTQRALLEASTAEKGQLCPTKIEELAIKLPKTVPATTNSPTPKKFAPILDGTISSGANGWRPRKKSTGGTALDDWLSDTAPAVVAQAPAKAAKPTPVTQAKKPELSSLAAKPELSDAQRDRIEQNRLTAMKRRKAKLEERQSDVSAVIAAADEKDQAKRSKVEPQRPVYRIPLQGLDAAKYALRHPDPVQLALIRAQQIGDSQSSHVDMLQLLHLFVGVLFHQIETRAGYEDIYSFVSGVSGMVTHCILEMEWSKKDMAVARDMIYPFIAASFDGKNPIVYDVLHALRHNPNLLNQESSLAVELLCKTTKVEREMVFNYLASLSDSELFPPLLSKLLFQMATLQAECVQRFAHSKLLGLIMRVLKQETPAVHSDDFVQLVAVLVHVLPYAVQAKTVQLPEWMPGLLLILGTCFSLVASELQNTEERSRGYDVFERMLTTESASAGNAPSICERVAVLGRFSLLGANDEADIVRDRSISELSYNSAHSNEMSVITRPSGAGLPEDASSGSQPAVTHLKLIGEASNTVSQPGPLFGEGKYTRVSSLTVLSDTDGIVGIEYEVSTISGARHRVQLQPHGVLIGDSKIVDNSANGFVGFVDPTEASLAKPVSINFDDDELFHGVTARRQGGVLRDVRITTSRRVTPWLLAASLGHVWSAADDESEVQHLDHSHYTPGFAAATMWPILTTIDPIVALVVSRERQSMTHITDIGVVVERSSTSHRPTEALPLSELHTSLTLQLFWLLYTLFPAHTLRWMRDETTREPQHSAIISAILPTVRTHPRLLSSAEAELIDGAWDGWSALQILAMCRDLCGISGSKYLRFPEDTGLTLPETNETAATGYVLDLGSMIRRTIIDADYARKSTPILSSPRGREAYPTASADITLDRPRARSSAHALLAPPSPVVMAPPRHELMSSAANQLPVTELKRISQVLREDHNVWVALTSFLIQQQGHIRTLEQVAGIEKIRCSQLQQQLVEQQRVSQASVAELEQQWAEKLLEVKASYECKLKQLFDEHRTTTDEIKADHLKLRRDMTMRMLKYDVMHRKLGDENARFRHEVTELRSKLSSTEAQHQELVGSSTLEGATRGAFMEQKQQLEEALDALETARLKLVTVEENAAAVARKEMEEQLTAREALIQNLATSLLTISAGHTTGDSTGGGSKPLDSGIVRMLLAELQKRPHVSQEDHNPLNPPIRRRSLSAEGIDSIPLHHRSRSESSSGIVGRAPDERCLADAHEQIRKLQHELEQQAAMLEQARNETQETKQVAATRIQAMTRKESSLLTVIATLERRVIQLIRENGGTQSSIFELPPHMTPSISGGGDIGRHSSFRASTVHTASTNGSEHLDPDANKMQTRTLSSHATLDPRQTRMKSSTSRRSPGSSSSSSSDGESEAHPVRLHSKYSVGSAHEDRGDRHGAQPKDQCRQS